MAAWVDTDGRRFPSLYGSVPVASRSDPPPTKPMGLYADLKPVIMIDVGPKASSENRKFMAKFMNINQFAALAQAPHAKLLSTLKLQDGLKIPAPEHDNYSLWKYGVTTGTCHTHRWVVSGMAGVRLARMFWRRVLATSTGFEDTLAAAPGADPWEKIDM